MRTADTPKSTGFIGSVLTIFLSQLVVKLAGFLYRVVITNIDGFGDMGNGFYNAGFQIYMLLLAISSVGIPNAISKLVSAELAVGNEKRVHEIFRTSLVLFFWIGLICSAVLYAGADFLALHVIRMDGAQATLRALSPAVLFVCLSAVIRGYFMGLHNVKATSRSQMLEQIIKAVLTIVVVLILTGRSAEIMSAGANFATSIAAASSIVYLANFYLRSEKGKPAIPITWQWSSILKLSYTILSVSVPISLAAIIASAGRVIDTATITRGIASAFADGIPNHIGIPSAAELNDEAVRLSGMLSKSDSLVNLPLALNIAFATVLVPTISAAMASGQREDAQKKVEFSLLFSILFILPCAAGLIVLAEPIYQMLYPSAPQGYQLLQISALGMVFVALNQTLTGSLQGLGKIFVPSKALLFGIGAKVVLNLWLIRIPAINIYGAPIASFVCYLIAFLVSFLSLKNFLKLCLPVGKYLTKPLACTVLMGISTVIDYQLFCKILASNGVAVILSIFCSAVLYLYLITRSCILSGEEIILLTARIKRKQMKRASGE